MPLTPKLPDSGTPQCRRLRPHLRPHERSRRVLGINPRRKVALKVNARVSIKQAGVKVPQSRREVDPERVRIQPDRHQHRRRRRRRRRPVVRHDAFKIAARSSQTRSGSRSQSSARLQALGCRAHLAPALQCPLPRFVGIHRRGRCWTAAHRPPASGSPRGSSQTSRATAAASCPTWACLAAAFSPVRVGARRACRYPGRRTQTGRGRSREASSADAATCGCSASTGGTGQDVHQTRFCLQRGPDLYVPGATGDLSRHMRRNAIGFLLDHLERRRGHSRRLAMGHGQTGVHEVILSG